MAQTCSRCGTLAGDDAYFCPHCSNKLAGPSYVVPAAPAPRSRFPFVLVTLGFCLVLGVAGAVFYLQVTQAQHTTDNAIATYHNYGLVGDQPTATPRATGIVDMAGQPDRGAILFGSSFDPDTMIVSGPTTKVSLGASFAIVAHFSSTISETGWFDVRSGKTTVTHNPLSITGATDYVGFVETTDGFSLGESGTYLVVMTDVGGNELARGTLTIGS